jgi:imidazole glycerol-phosphate synthase subunit HisH
VPVSDFTLATAHHADEFSAVIHKDNFIAAQFHPERSSRAGAHLLGSFLEWQI